MNYYNEISKGYSELHGEEQMKKARIMLERLSPKPNDTLLDVGCGDAAYLDIFRCDATGIDPSEELLEKYKGDLQVLEGVAEALPFEDDSFDFVISITAVQNFANIEKGLSEMHRVGKKTAKFAISTLKRGPKIDEIKRMISENFNVADVVEEEKDLIFFCSK